MNFQQLAELIKSDVEKITLTEDVILDECEEHDFRCGIQIKRDNVIIDGKCHAVDGKNKVSLLNVKSFNVTLENIIFKNGCFENSGGAVNNEGDLTVRECRFMDNSSDDFGGAIYNAPNSKLAIGRCEFKSNRSDYGGAIFLDSNSILNLEGSVFKHNTSEFEGGAIFNKAKLRIYGSLFTKNASFKGGAIYNEAILNIADCDFEGNIASDGNDIESENEKDLTIHNCNFIG